MKLKLKLVIGLTSVVPLAMAGVGYVGLELGVDNQTLSGSNSTYIPSAGNFTTNNVSFIGRVQGGYIFDKYNSIEVGYNYLSGLNYQLPNDSSITGSTNVVDLSYILSIPTMIDNFAVYARVGAAYDWISASTNDNLLGTPSGSGVVDVLGAGIKYKIAENWAWRLEWIGNGILFPMSVTQGNNTVGTQSTQLFLTGINYLF